MQAIVVIFLKKSCLYELHLNGLISTPKSCKVALHSNSSFCYDCLLLCSCSLVVVEYSWWLDPTTCCSESYLSRTRDVMWLYIFAVYRRSLQFAFFGGREKPWIIKSVNYKVYWNQHKIGYFWWFSALKKTWIARIHRELWGLETI